MNILSAATLTAHFPAVVPEIRRTLENEKPLAAGTEKGNKGKKQNAVHSSWPVTIRGDSAQLPPLAAKLDGMASHLVKVAESVDLPTEIGLVIFAHNLAALAEQVAHMENNLEMPA